MTVDRSINVLTLMSSVYNVEGDIIEVGIFKGDTLLMIA